MAILMESIRAEHSSGLVQKTCFRRLDFFVLFSPLVGFLESGATSSLQRLVVVGFLGSWVSACLRSLIIVYLSGSVFPVGLWHCGQYQSSFDLVKSYNSASVIPRWLM